MFANDNLQKKGLCVTNILDGLSFWAQNTPDATAIRYPSKPDSSSFETVTWLELENATRLGEEWLQKTLALPSDAADKAIEDDTGLNIGSRTVTLLIAPSHDNLCLWLGLARMGYTTQFISPAHMPDVIGSLIGRANSAAVITSGLASSWVQDTQAALEKQNKRTNWVLLDENQASLSSLLKSVRSSPKAAPKESFALAKAPEPFVLLHSFGSTSMPKLYPLNLSSANFSAQDTGKFWLAMPTEARWRTQLQTSLPFHFSFQQPVWRALQCGTTLVFPAIRANASSHTKTTAKAGITLVPDAHDILSSIAASKADVLYASPTGLSNVAQLALVSEQVNLRTALAGVKQAHTGGAPVTRLMADTYTQAGLSVMQLFASTEAGVLFIGLPAVTGHLCNLTPRPQVKDKMLFYQPDSSNDTLELWLPPDFPALQKRGLKFERFPGNSNIQAWNTCDLFARIKGSTDAAPLYEFRGRTDDWLRLTSGTACRALEIEDRLTEIMQSGTEEDTTESKTPSLSGSSSKTSPTDSRDGSPSSSEARRTGRVEHVTALGNARKTLSAVIQLRDHAEPTEEERNLALNAADRITDEQLQYPAVLKPEAIIFATKDRTIHVTQKGSLQRKKNEETFAPVLNALDL